MAGDNSIRFFNWAITEELSAERIDLSDDTGRVTQMTYTLDGHQLTLSTASGRLLNILLVPSPGCAYGSRVDLLPSTT